MTRRFSVLTLTVVCVLLQPHVAHADGQTSAAAQMAFDEAAKLTEQGQHEAACAKLESSLALEEALGARFALAECYEKIGRLGSSWQSYIRVADDAATQREVDKERYARERADKLRPRVPLVTVMIPDAARSLPNLAFSQNGEVLATALIGTAMPVDPGTHRYTVSADGYEPASADVVVTNQSGAQTVTLPMLVAGPGGQASAGSRGISPFAIVGLVGAGLGLAGMGVGVGLAAAASSDYDDAVAGHCTDGRCDPEGLTLTEDARSQGTLATVLFAVGGGVAAVGIGLTIYGFTAGSGETTAMLMPVPGGGVLSVRGAF